MGTHLQSLKSNLQRRATELAATTMTQKLGFFEDFMLAGVAAGVSKTCAAPIERVKLLVQNQDEMIKQGRLKEPYKGVIDCTTRVLKTEGIVPFWRGNLANVLRYFPTQALNFAFKDTIKGIFNTPKDAPQWQKFGTNILSGGVAGSMSLTFVYSLDYARTRLANDAKGKGGERQFNGLVDVYVKTLKTDGIQGLYRGFAISCVGIFHLSWYVLRHVRFIETHFVGRRCRCSVILLVGLGSLHWCWFNFLPH